MKNFTRNISQLPGAAFQIRDVIEKDICIGCGACAVATDGAIRVTPNATGMYAANADDLSNLDRDQYELANAVCPFSDAAMNEDQLGPPQKSIEAMDYDSSVGYYKTFLAGRQRNDETLIGSSSGGLTSWLLTQLLRSGKIDGVIHAGKGADVGDRIFDYRLSFSTEEVDENRKSFYYSTTLADVIIKLRDFPGKRFAIVGVPCFIKASRLLANSSSYVDSSIKYYIGIICGHMKSSLFAESNAWQVGVPPTQLSDVDFRVKKPGKKSSQYEFSARSKLDGSVSSREASKLLGGSWGHGFFQPNACNYCDDVFAETADAVFGDAWLPKYRDDWRGTNILAIRNSELAEIFTSGSASGEIDVDEVTLEDAVSSQAGGLRHRRTGLKVRLYDDKRHGIPAPLKRVSPTVEGIAGWRMRLIRQRKTLSALSGVAFMRAKDENNLAYFMTTMKNEIGLYKYLEMRKYPDVKKRKFFDVALFGWHHQANLGGSLTVFALHQILEAAGLSVVVVWRPGRSNVNAGNRGNHEILKKYYKYSKLRSAEDLHELRAFCDFFVLASDQLWAGKWVPFEPEYEFLGAGDDSVTKISVATSFGGDGKRFPFDGEKAAIVTHLLRSIDHVSVREPAAVNILKDLGVEGTQILDPVFLALPSVYSELISHANVDIRSERFVLAYILDPERDLIDFGSIQVPMAVNAKSTHFMTTMKNSNKQEDKLAVWTSFGEIEFTPYATFADLVKAISMAEYVFTDSFHGACLAVIFKKRFICCPKDMRGSSRFEIFEMLGLGNRIVSRDALGSVDIDRPIDWDQVESVLGPMRYRSLDWLSRAFKRKFQTA